MPAPEDWRAADKAYVRGLLTGWVPDSIPIASPTPAGAAVAGASGGWVGIVQENTVLVPNPVPSGKKELPTLFAAWKVEWSKVAANFDSSGAAPARDGKLTIALFTEDGAQGGALDTIASGLLNLLDIASDQEDEVPPFCFDAQSARPITVGPRPPWFAINLEVPFHG